MGLTAVRPGVRRILVDFHHHALAESLLRLFEDRLGWDVYFPQGMDWYHQDHWVFERDWHGDAVAKQYLLGIWSDAAESDGVMLRPDPRHPGRRQWGVSLGRAKDMQWDVVLSSLPHNDAGMARFAEGVGAVFGVQVGNAHQQSRWDLARFILASSTLPDHGLVERSRWARLVSGPRMVPTVVYHQEFDLDTFRFEWPPERPGEVASFVNCFPEGPSYPDFLAFARRHLDEFDFRVYGATGRPSWYSGEGPYRDEFTAPDIGPVPEVAATMRAAGMGWHSKHWSDGFGHTVHNWFALGRPVLGIPRYYEDKLAGPLFIDGVTSFDIERRSEGELVGIMRRLRDDPEYHREISTNAAVRFREVVDFDAEEEAIRQMLGAVLP